MIAYSMMWGSTVDICFVFLYNSCTFSSKSWCLKYWTYLMVLCKYSNLLFTRYWVRRAVEDWRNRVADISKFAERTYESGTAQRGEPHILNLLMIS